MIQSVAVFCGSRHGVRADFQAAAEELGRRLAREGWTLVYGGGHVGLMGRMADAALSAGGRVIGVIPAGLFDQEVAHAGLTELRVTRDMHERKAQMAQASDAFVALPGGFGTLDELCEIITWAQLGIHQKPVVLLNTGGFWDRFLEFIGDAEEAGFISPAHRDLLQVVATVDELIQRWASPSPSSNRS